MGYKLTREALLLDLWVAYEYAKRHKSRKPYVRRFARNLKENLEALADGLISRTYTPEPSTCFIIEHPKKREVFAAHFKDRIVHHLYYNYTHEMFERTFIHDTYSCIPNRGTHYGIRRLARHIRRASRNYTVPCYVMKLDKRGYFMHIDRNILLSLASDTITRMQHRPISRGSSQRWSDVVDIGFVLWLTREIVLLDPKKNCVIVGSAENWKGLDRNKSLFYTLDGCGLPIGNLTSQLFSNVYLNAFDQFMKRIMGCRHYGRYVDDSYVISRNREWLKSLVPQVRTFLRDTLHLELHMGKLAIADARHGVEFLGAFIKPNRIYVANKTLARTRRGLDSLDTTDREAVYRSVNSYLGMLVHYDSYNIRCSLFLRDRFLSVSTFDKGVTKMNKPVLTNKVTDYEQGIWN